MDRSHTLAIIKPDAFESGKAGQVLAHLESAGFELVDFSDLHYRVDDELRFEVGRKKVTGNTDRFTLLFRKP